MESVSTCHFLVLVSVLLVVRCLSEDFRDPTIYPVTNHTLLKEYPTGTNQSFGCSISNLSANVTIFTITFPPSADSNTNITYAGSGSIILVNITHATPLANNGYYTCNATDEFGTSLLHYRVFVGGVPDAASAQATITSDISHINVSVSFTDNSSVPVTLVSFTIPGIPGSTYSQNITDPPLMGEVVILPTLSVNTSNSSEGQYTLQVNASNQIGSVIVLNQTLHLHNDHHQSLLIVLVLAGVLVFAGIAVIISGSIASHYCIKKTRRNNELFGNDDAFDNEEEEALQELIPKRSH